MKFLNTLVLSMFGSLGAASALPAELDESLAQRQVAEEVAGFDFQMPTTDLEDGKQKTEFIIDGVSEGYIIFSSEGEVIEGFYDDGSAIDFEMPIDEEVTAEKRVWPVFLARMAPIIARFGQRATAWLWCVYVNGWASKCVDKILRCAQMGTAPWDCTGALICMGRSATKCGRP